MDAVTYALCKKYIKDSMLGGGAVVGKNVTISSITETDDGNVVTFSYTLDNGTVKTSTMTVKNGEQGNGVAKVEKIKSVDLVDTYRMTFDDGSTFDYEVTNGDSSLGGKIDTVKVNGVELPVVDKAVDITIPEYIYIGNTEPTDENVVLWVNPDESGGGGTGGGSGTAEDTTYTNENFPQYNNVDLALDALFNKVYYVKPTCSLSADKKGGTFEMGTVISAPITFTWTTNKDIISQTLTGCTLADASVRTAIYNTNVTSNKTFTLSISDGENSASSSVSYSFLNNVFWGSASTGIYNSAFINALSNKKLASTVKGTYSFNIASEEYGFWAVPSNMTISSVWIGGFEVTVDDLGTVSYTNAQGYTRDYRIYKTGKSGLGVISAEIK